MFRTTKAALMIAMIAIAGSAPVAGSDVQSLQARLDQVIRSWQSGWIADAPVVDRDPPSQLFRWQRDGAVITVTVRDLADAPTAVAEVEGTPMNLSIGADAAPGIGDRAYVAYVPGGFTNVYVAVGHRVVHLRLHEAPDVAKPLAGQLATAVRNDSGGR
jgi:hypothetical protein